MANPEPSVLEERIWKCLNYVFELPLHLSRYQKARYIYSGLRDRTIVYQNFRKMRAPIKMEGPVGESPIGCAEKQGEEDPSIAMATAGGDATMIGTDLTYVGIVNGEALFAPPLHHGNSRTGSETSNGMNAVNMRPGGTGPSPPELMADIDLVSNDLSHFMLEPTDLSCFNHCRTNSTEYTLAMLKLGR